MGAEGVSVKPVTEVGSRHECWWRIRSTMTSRCWARRAIGTSPGGPGPVTSRVAEHSNDNRSDRPGTSQRWGSEDHGAGGRGGGPLLGLRQAGGPGGSFRRRRHAGPRGGNALAACGDDQEWIGYEEEKEEEIDPQAQFEREFETEGDEILENAAPGCRSAQPSTR